MEKKEIESWLIKSGWELDAWGHYHKKKMNIENKLIPVRMKMQASSVRYEHEDENGDFMLIATDFYKDCELIDDRLKINDILVRG